MTFEDFVRRGQAAQTAVDAIALTTTLRAWLRARQEPSPVVASALVYELTAILARDADTPAAACELIDVWARVMKAQIRDFGVGVEHP